MINMAGEQCDPETISGELKEAGMEQLKLTTKGEVNCGLVGFCGPWKFERAWTYWIASGPGLPLADAWRLHTSHGKVVRVDGHCGAPTPDYCKGFPVSCYHIDTQEGLNAIAETIRRIQAPFDKDNE